MRINLLWIGTLAAVALPACGQQYVTQPNTTDFTVSTKFVFSAPAVNLMTQADRTAGCPVSMHAQRRQSGATMQAGDRPTPLTAEQRIHLEIEGGQDAAIEAKVTVHGTRGGARMTPASATSDANRATGAAQSFTLRPGKDGAAHMATDLVLAGFTSVSSISLDAITYADGSGWHAASGRSCVVQPDPLMLVNQH